MAAAEGPRSLGMLEALKTKVWAPARTADAAAGSPASTAATAELSPTSPGTSPPGPKADLPPTTPRPGTRGGLSEVEDLCESLRLKEAELRMVLRQISKKHEEDIEAKEKELARVQAELRDATQDATGRDEVLAEELQQARRLRTRTAMLEATIAAEAEQPPAVSEALRRKDAEIAAARAELDRTLLEVSAKQGELDKETRRTLELQAQARALERQLASDEKMASKEDDKDVILSCDLKKVVELTDAAVKRVIRIREPDPSWHVLAALQASRDDDEIPSAALLEYLKASSAPRAAAWRYHSPQQDLCALAAKSPEHALLVEATDVAVQRHMAVVA